MKKRVLSRTVKTDSDEVLKALSYSQTSVDSKSLIYQTLLHVISTGFRTVTLNKDFPYCGAAETSKTSTNFTVAGQAISYRRQ